MDEQRDEPVSALVVFRARPGRRDDFRDLVVRMVELTNREHGPLHYSASQVASDLDVFVVFELWPDRASVEAHLSAPGYQKLSAEARDAGLLVPAGDALALAGQPTNPMRSVQLRTLAPRAG